jgi:hypothetical protein
MAGTSGVTVAGTNRRWTTGSTTGPVVVLVRIFSGTGIRLDVTALTLYG